jgi:acyl carrier protein
MRGEIGISTRELRRHPPSTFRGIEIPKQVARIGVLFTAQFRYSSALPAPGTREDMVSVIQAIGPTQVLQKVRSTVAVELEDDTLCIDESTIIGELPQWDSVAHFRIMVALENDFGILFDLDEHTEFETVGQVVACICRKLLIAGRA